ncbi:cobalamin-independent methionine synthase II family protein [Falsiroseomonas stagni]|uniref:5-methyltetrahydropteroyltriglutamate--homocysteine methyltransferase n=1 Tax=Falsiroseomonas stagni DSM 19981 TaxID=1123062 RepID=A0A1I3XVT3_9PROT|nr:cobalamin-independent methionine synthase II family protein [Falsiroseomonas stagni]SFK23106.1 5-methyltetrahydropteroyltriglutamate--homocysteine methyltransferase [Falsiroseomonas stagni DSM 19981]
MQRSETRILTTHTGSLPRPAALTKLYARRVRGEAVDPAAIEAEGRAALQGIIPKQIESGLDIINNGEQQRESFVLYLRHRLSGLGDSSSRTGWADLDAYPDYKAQLKELASKQEAVTNTDFLPAAIGEVRYLDPAAVNDECTDFRTALAAHSGSYAEAFLTAPSPGIIGSIVQNRHYATEEAYLAALGDALKVEYEAIVAQGFVLQLDCPDLALERHCSYRDRPLSDFLQFCERVITAINRAIANIPRDRVRLHVCWGNYEGPHDHDVPLEDILPIVTQANVGGFVLPFANPRHAHEYKIFERKPLAEDQILVAGVLDTTTNFIEHPEVIADRIERVARVMGDPRRVQAGTDCGFDTSAGRGRVANDVVWAKLKSMRQGAEMASARLFRS